jgi:hypothetical protein
MPIVTPRHIGSGIAFFIVGGLFLAIDIFAVLTQSVSEPRAFMLGGGMITVAGIIGGVIIALGFSVRLFGLVEARLIEIEQAIVAMRETTPPPSKPGAAASPTPPSSTAA